MVTLLEADYPLVRFATGDLSAIMPGLSPCGRTNARLRGWMGRADQVTKIRGMFRSSRPGERGGEEAPGGGEGAPGRLPMTAPPMTWCGVEVEGDASALSQDALLDDLRAATKLRGRLSLVTPGTLGADAKTIEDRRTVG